MNEVGIRPEMTYGRIHEADSDVSAFEKAHSRRF